MSPLPDSGVCYRAVSGRDPRFDGWIYVGITSTGIYCRPSCPARTPHLAHCRFFADAGAAQREGFRACRRCRPDTVPGSPQWNPRADAAGRAMRLITDGIIDRHGVAGLATAIGYSERQLNRLLIDEVGTGPLAIARAQRATTARMLIENTELGMADVAFAAGFASVRQFNDTVRAVYDRPPSALRGQIPDHSSGSAVTPPPMRIRLASRQPYAAAPLFEFLNRRAIPSIESGSSADDELRFARTLRLPQGVGIAELIMDNQGLLTARLQLTHISDLAAAVSRIRRLFDLDADPAAVDDTLRADPVMSPLVQQLPGIRVPGAPSGDELAFRALIGQQVSVAGATTIAERIVTRVGEPLSDHGWQHTNGSSADPADGGLDTAKEANTPDADRDPQLTHLFPTADRLAGVNPNDLPMPRSRGNAIVGLATELASGRIDLSPGADRAETYRRLLALPGIGKWTAGYVTMRALGDPDVLLTQDLIIRRELQRRQIQPDNTTWSPWRSYATMHLWHASRMEQTA